LLQEGSKAAPERDCSIKGSPLVCLPIAFERACYGHRETVIVGYRKIKVASIRISDIGRRAFEG
jgi:hypothetical protein